MGSLDTAAAIAEPIGRVGSWYYFTPATGQRAEEIGLNVISFYAMGRGGVLGDVSNAEIAEAFYFFPPHFIGGMLDSGRGIQSLPAAAAAHLDAADAFARGTFGGVPTEVLEGFAGAAAALMAAVPTGRWPLVDGYRSFPVPQDPAAAAYRYSIILRELRGSVHIDAIVASGLTAVEACYLDSDGRQFALHGYTESDTPNVDDDARRRRDEAEAATSAAMASFMDSLTADQQQALVDGALAMRAALKQPVPVSV
jgi:hypothetical protein